MLENSNANLLNTNIGRNTPTYTPSQNKYYNIFSKQMEEFEIPVIDWEHNAVLNTETSKFMWNG